MSCAAVRRPAGVYRRTGLAGRSCRPVLEALEDRCLLSYSITDLGTLGGSFSHAYGINASGQVVGLAQTAVFGPSHAFLYDGTVTPAMQDLGTLGGRDSLANSINDSGQVVGYAQRAGNSGWHAFLYDATATPAMQDLGTLGGWYGVATGINASGQVVGYAVTADNALHAFLYDGTAMLNLDDQIPSDSGWSLGQAFAINDNGQIVGNGDINGQGHAFLLTPDAGPGATPAAHRTRATIPAPVSTSLVAGEGSVLAANATLVSIAALGSVLSPAGHGPVLAPTPQAVPGPEAGVAPALATNVTVTREQSATPAPSSHHAPDGLDLFFADLGQDLRLDGRLA